MSCDRFNKAGSVKMATLEVVISKKTDNATTCSEKILFGAKTIVV